jgi:hypothetical protein
MHALNATLLAIAAGAWISLENVSSTSVEATYPGKSLAEPAESARSDPFGPC